MNTDLLGIIHDYVIKKDEASKRALHDIFLENDLISPFNYGTDKKKTVSAEEFVLTWQSSSSTDEVVAKLGIPKATVVARASIYRQKGLNLKKFTRTKSLLDVDALNALL